MEQPLKRKRAKLLNLFYMVLRKVHLRPAHQRERNRTVCPKHAQLLDVPGARKLSVSMLIAVGIDGEPSESSTLKTSTGALENGRLFRLATCEKLDRIRSTISGDICADSVPMGRIASDDALARINFD